MENEVEIKTVACSGNRLPWQASAYVGGQYVGTTGFCKTEYRAAEAAAKLVAQYKAVVR